MFNTLQSLLKEHRKLSRELELLDEIDEVLRKKKTTDISIEDIRFHVSKDVLDPLLNNMHFIITKRYNELHHKLSEIEEKL